jgi:hypothetical protein
VRTRTSNTPRRSAFAAIVLTAGLAVGASACGSDDDTDDPGTDIDVDTPADTSMTGTVPMDTSMTGTMPTDSMGG